jgi:hypothetical protein
MFAMKVPNAPLAGNALRPRRLLKALTSELKIAASINPGTLGQKSNCRALTGIVTFVEKSGKESATGHKRPLSPYSEIRINAVPLRSRTEDRCQNGRVQIGCPNTGKPLPSLKQLTHASNLL